MVKKELTNKGKLLMTSYYSSRTKSVKKMQSNTVILVKTNAFYVIQTNEPILDTPN